MFEQIAGAVLGGLLGGQGGSQSSTVDKSPWSAAAPWLTDNLRSGQALQNYYAANPFSQAQQGAYNNSFNLSNAYRSALPGLLSQMQSSGFDPANPLQKPKGYDFSQLAGALGGNLGFSNVQPSYAAPNLTPYQPAAAPAAPTFFNSNEFRANQG